MLLRQKAVRSALLFLLALPLAASIAVVVAGLHDQLHAADLAVVPGSKVYRDGRPSEQLQARLDEASKLYHQGYFSLILVSGAHGKEGYDEPKVMRRYLESQEVPATAILEDNAGKTTWLTARNTARTIKERHLQSVLVISQYFHMARCRLALGRFGIAPVYACHAPFWSLRDFYSVPREVLGYLDYALQKKPEPFLADSKKTGSACWRERVQLQA